MQIGIITDKNGNPAGGSSSLTIPPVAANWTASGSSSVIDVPNGIAITANGGAVPSCVHVTSNTAYDSSKTYIARLNRGARHTDLSMGLALVDAGGAIRGCGLYFSAGAGGAFYTSWTSTTARTSTGSVVYGAGAFSTFWMKLSLSGGNYIWSVSSEGRQWDDIVEANVASAGFTPTKIGWWTENDSTNAYCVIDSWNVL